MSEPREVDPLTLFAAERRQMVDFQLMRRGIRHPRVLAAMLAVPRELFIPQPQWDMAYDDGALAIGHGQTISQPYTVAFMCEAAQLRDDHRVLEVGTGCGYGAASLAQLAARVDTIERIPELAELARNNLARLGDMRVHVHTGDGTLGLPELAPFDAIVVTAGAQALPAAYAHQLAEGGRIVIPIGEGRHSQMYRFTKLGGELRPESLGGFAFVPLVGEGPTQPMPGSSG